MKPHTKLFLHRALFVFSLMFFSSQTAVSSISPVSCSPKDIDILQQNIQSIDRILYSLSGVNKMLPADTNNKKLVKQYNEFKHWTQKWSGVLHDYKRFSNEVIAACNVTHEGGAPASSGSENTGVFPDKPLDEINYEDLTIFFNKLNIFDPGSHMGTGALYVTILLTASTDEMLGESKKFIKFDAPVSRKTRKIVSVITHQQNRLKAIAMPDVCMNTGDGSDIYSHKERLTTSRQHLQKESKVYSTTNLNRQQSIDLKHYNTTLQKFADNMGKLETAADNIIQQCASLKKGEFSLKTVLQVVEGYQYHLLDVQKYKHEMLSVNKKHAPTSHAMSNKKKKVTHIISNIR